MIDRLDHFVLTTAQPEEIIRFYTEVLGMKLETFRNGQRLALKFGKQKINIHVKGKEYEPKAHAPGVGTLDFCFIASVPLAQVVAEPGEAQGRDHRGAVHQDRGDGGYTVGLFPGSGFESGRGVGVPRMTPMACAGGGAHSICGVAGTMPYHIRVFHPCC